ncbi:hypothetical protein [Cupriavidus sp. CuC1]|uniref:hypothetical protein n=1 Tax=Cupriavidus sp. CuC1 TaxID=3373131 RepID=UPI0037CFE2C1
MKASRHTPLPSFAIDLLYVAKMVAHPPVNATPEQLVEYLERLDAAVIAFEAAMPIVDGVIVERHANAGA